MPRKAMAGRHAVRGRGVQTHLVGGRGVQTHLVGGRGSRGGGTRIVGRGETRIVGGDGGRVGGSRVGGGDGGGSWRLTRSKARELSLEQEESPTEKKKGKRMQVEAESEGSSITTLISRPVHTRFPPFPSLSNKEEQSIAVLDWRKECIKLEKLQDNSVLSMDVPTLRDEYQDPDTADAVVCDRDKSMIISVAHSLVAITSSAQYKESFSGIIIGWDEANKRARIITSSSVVCDYRGKLFHPAPKLAVYLPNRDKTIVEGQLLFFNAHYCVALLEIKADLPLQPASFGSSPHYGQEVFALARDETLSLMVRRGTILWLGNSFLWRNHCMLLSCNIPEGGTGGPVVDNDGSIIGMAFDQDPSPAILSIYTISTCIDMWNKFSRVARPVHGMELRSVKLLNVSLQEELSRDYNIDHGFIVDMLDDDSTAEKLGIRRGDVIYFSELSGSTLPQLEDSLLSLGWKYLRGESLVVDLKLEVHDLFSPSRGSITFPLQFSDVSEQQSFFPEMKEKKQKKKSKGQESSRR